VNEPFETLVLRFRDLVTVPGGTIDLHRAQISADGAVWWGWWKKSGEAAPETGIRSIPNATKLLLFDSGHHRLYWASYNGIAVSRGKAVPSPTPGQTPAYYRDQKYEAWFRLTQIEDVPLDKTTETLQHYAYVQRDEFFENGKSRYGTFYNKIVFGPEELRDQDRTMWFVRPRAPTDRVNEVRLLAAKSLQPSHFPEEFTQSKSCNLLWLSDLHFSVDSHHAYPTEDDVPAGKSTLATKIEQALSENGISDLAGIVVSGDLTWKAHADEYRLFLAFLRRATTSPSKLDNYRLAIAPGNHDLAFSDAPDKKDAKVAYALDDAKRAFSDAYSTLFYLGPNQYCCSGRRFLLGGCLPVEVVCLNSSVLQQKPGWFQGHGFVGESQLKFVEEQMGWGQEPNGMRPRRILVLHHHLMPVNHREEPVGGAMYSVTLDAQAVVEFVVRHRIELVLHGHMHETFFATITRKLLGVEHTYRVAGLGSSGVSREHRRDGCVNFIGVLGFNDNGLTLKFIPLRDASGNPAGNPIVHEIS